MCVASFEAYSGVKEPIALIQRGCAVAVNRHDLDRVRRHASVRMGTALDDAGSAALLPLVRGEFSAHMSSGKKTAMQQGLGVNLPSATSPFGLVFCFRRRDGLPLHVGWLIGSPAGKRHNVIDHVSVPAVRIAGRTLERVFGFFTSKDLSVLVAIARLAPVRFCMRSGSVRAVASLRM